MDDFEKQQRIESIRNVVKNRWFFIGVVLSLGIFLKTRYFGSWAANFGYLKFFALFGTVFAYNFGYWLFLKRPAEKIGENWLKIVAALQLIVDIILVAIMFYFNGTVESMSFLYFFIPILSACSLYKTRGIIFSGLFVIFLHSGILIAEYFRYIPHQYAYPGTVWFGNLYVTRGKIFTFIFYTFMIVFGAAVISALIRRREKSLAEQRDRLFEYSQGLAKQTQELTKTKDWLHEALTKSDKAKTEISKTKEELEKANAKLKAKIDELEKFNRVTVGREIRMSELKEKIRGLENKIAELENK